MRSKEDISQAKNIYEHTVNSNGIGYFGPNYCFSLIFLYELLLISKMHSVPDVLVSFKIFHFYFF